METLEQLRKKIDTIDGHLIDLLAERFFVVADIGKYKKEYRLPVLDRFRRAQLLKTNIHKGKKKGLTENFIIDVRETIHKESLKIQ